MDNSISYLSGLLVGLLLTVLFLFFVLWRFQRLYDMLVLLRTDIRDFIADARTELLAQKKPKVEVELTADFEQSRVQMQKAMDALNKAAKND